MGNPTGRKKMLEKNIDSVVVGGDGSEAAARYEEEKFPYECSGPAYPP